jgi:hypothetical protein
VATPPLPPAIVQPRSQPTPARDAPPEPVEVHIGTIEVQVAAPDAPASPPVPSAPPGFADYAAIR